MSNRQKKYQEFMDHLAEKNQCIGGEIAYGGLMLIGIFGFVLNAIGARSENKKADEIWNSDLNDHLWIDKDDPNRE